MTGLFRTTVVEISGVRTISGGGTNASNAGQALANLGGVSIAGDQTVAGQKTFSNPSTIFGAGNFGEIQISDDAFGGELGILTTNDEVLAIKFNDGSFRYGGGNPGDEPLIISNGVASFTKRPTVNGTGVLLSGERNKKFIYSGATRGPASRTLSNVYNNIAYGANCTFTPRYVGTIKAEASVGLTVPSTTADTIQAATFWYGTGTPPVFSGNLNDLTNITRIGGIKGTPQTSATQPTLQFSPIGASWVAEVTGLTTGTSYWFDIAMSGRFLRVQDVQIYLEEIY
jgi:hypothetical protein